MLYCDNKLGSSCDFHRILLPFTGNKFKPKQNVLVFNRIFSGGTEEVKRLKASGFKVIVDLDDFYNLNPNHYLAEVFTQHSKNIIEMVKIADVVTVTTELLAYKLRHLNRNIVVIRNALPFDTGQFKLSEDYISDTPVIWAGGASHYADLQLITNVFNTRTLTLAGYEKTGNPLSCKEWVKIKQALPDVYYKPSIKDLNRYMEAYNGHSVAIAPLVGNEFNSCKSNLKILEAGAKGLPIICSKVMPYCNPIDEDFVIYAENKTEWQEKTLGLARNPARARELGAKLAEHVRLHYDLADANELRRQVVESL